jgi:hypothetical protein
VIQLRARYDVICYRSGMLRNPCHTNIDVVMPLLAGSCSMSSSVIGVGDQTAAATRVLVVVSEVRTGPTGLGFVALLGVVGRDGHGGLHAVVHQVSEGFDQKRMCGAYLVLLICLRSCTSLLLSLHCQLPYRCRRHCCPCCLCHCLLLL